MLLRDAIYLVPKLGLGACAYQAVYRLQRRTGLLENRFPAVPWEAVTLARYVTDTPTDEAFLAARAGQDRFFLPPGRPSAVAAFLMRQPEGTITAVLDEAAAIAAGDFRYFSDARMPLGSPPDWCHNPFTGQRADPRVHWCRLPDFSEQQGDVKVLWEASRFSWVYALARAYAATGDPSHAAVFWQWLESWRAQNAPNLGPQWKCGQECAFRVMAMTLAFHVFADAPTSTPARQAMLAATIAFHAERIEGNLAYAWSIRNNHGISEALGIFTVGLLFPEFEPSARWRERGRELLEAEARRQIFDDGAFIQHSLNYHRLMLQDYAWALALGDANGVTFSPALRARVGAATRFLAAMLDEASGDVPNYGHNDGALILPLDSGGYRDFRGAIQMASVATDGRPMLAPGPWDEGAIWLCGTKQVENPRAPGPAGSFDAPVGGYYTLRGRDSWAMTRCHTYSTRPAQADMLNVDLWWRGLNVLQDGGTYHYAAPPPWDRAFFGTAGHNAVVVDDRDQMRRVGRFLWTDWTASEFLGRASFLGGEAEAWAGSHQGYRPTIHRRTLVRLGEAVWLVIDELTGPKPVTASLAWRLPDVPVLLAPAARLTLDTTAGVITLEVLGADADFALCRAEESGLGWRSVHYGTKVPAQTLHAVRRGPLPMRIVMAIGLGVSFTTKLTDSEITVASPAGRYRVQLGPPGSDFCALQIDRLKIS